MPHHLLISLSRLPTAHTLRGAGLFTSFPPHLSRSPVFARQRVALSIHYADRDRSQPHTRFVVVLVGPDETPFGLQKDFLCFKSSYYRAYFADHPTEQLEHIVHLPEATEEVFGLVQNFIYTGRLLTGLDALPAYDILIATWKIGHKLGIDGLCDDVLEAMAECKRLTQHIPATPLLVQVWNDTPEGSSIRQLLLTWAAEYIRSSESRSEFSKSLPQEVLSELVIAMSHLDSSPVIQLNHGSATNTANQRKNVRYLEADDSDEEPRKKVTKHRHSDVVSAPSPVAERTPAGPSERRKPGSRASLPNLKAPRARKSHSNLPSDHQFTAEQKLNFCSDLLTRMLSGPGRRPQANPVF